MNRCEALLPRLLEASLAAALRRFPVVVLTGARQTGKTTLVGATSIAKGRTFRSLDDFDVLDRALEEPDLLLQDAECLTLDEVQRAPEMLLAIKRDVDRAREPGRFLLTGSANLLMMRRVSESLAGRAIDLTLWPLTEREKQGRAGAGPWSDWLAAPDVRAAGALFRSTKTGDWAPRILAGGYPIPALAAEEGERAQWFDGYVRTYLERDLQDLASVSSLSDFRRLIRLAAHRVGQILNQSELARDAALTQPTTHRYLNLLETSYQIVRLPAFAVSQTKRLVKSPKIFWTDTGLAAHLAGFTTPGTAPSPPAPGALLENLVLTQILAWRETVVPRPQIHYWRTRGGIEVDFVIEDRRRLLPVEVKFGRRVRPADARGLGAFLDDHRGSSPFGVLLYGGDETVLLAERIIAVPLGCLWN
ncbi:MAG: ATP-binding protein [Acidobacteriota bacterium]